MPASVRSRTVTGARWASTVVTMELHARGQVEVVGAHDGVAPLA